MAVIILRAYATVLRAARAFNVRRVEIRTSFVLTGRAA